MGLIRPRDNGCLLSAASCAATLIALPSPEQWEHIQQLEQLSDKRQLPKPTVRTVAERVQEYGAPPDRHIGSYHASCI